MLRIVIRSPSRVAEASRAYSGAQSRSLDGAICSHQNSTAPNSTPQARRPAGCGMASAASAISSAKPVASASRSQPGSGPSKCSAIAPQTVARAKRE